MRPTWGPEWDLWGDFRLTFATFWSTVGSHTIFLRSRTLGESAENDLGCPRDPPGTDFGTIFGNSLRRFRHSWRSSFVPTLSQVCHNSRSVVVLPSVPRLGLPALSCRGGARVERAINLIV